MQTMKQMNNLAFFMSKLPEKTISYGCAIFDTGGFLF